MQLVNAPRDALLKPLSTVVGIVERRHTLPILANILIKKTGPRVALIATDLEVQITTHADFGVGEGEEATTVAARKLLDILRALPDGKGAEGKGAEAQSTDGQTTDGQTTEDSDVPASESRAARSKAAGGVRGEVRLSLASGKLAVQSGKSRFALQTLAASEFPTVSQPERWDVSLQLPQKSLRHLLSMVHFAMALQDVRYYLNGMLLVFEPGRVCAVATDGHRLAYCTTPADGITASQSVIVPRKTVLELQRLLEDSDAPIAIDVAAGQIRCCFGAVELVSKLVEGKFPDYTRIIPTTYTRSVTLSREALLGSLQRAAILTADKFKGVRVQLQDNLLKISATNAEQEEAQEELDVAYESEPFDMGFNVAYLLDVLANLKSETITWWVQPGANTSTLMTLPDADSFKYVLMPMRV